MSFGFYSYPSLEGKHAICGASQGYWVNWDDNAFAEHYMKKMRTYKGTVLHEWAAQTIKLGIRQQSGASTLYKYVNDAIRFGMSPEVLLKANDTCFGTADSISFDERKHILRIHDLKTGLTPAKMRQIQIYAAYFCMNYNIRPGDIDMVGRIYQNNEIIEEKFETDEIAHIMSRATAANKIVQNINDEENYHGILFA